jgi:hypothetical protein
VVTGFTISGLLMDKKDKVSSVLQMVGGKPENVEKIVDEVDRFLDNLNAELEDWKVSMEEFQDGTRIFARFQILLRK